MPLRYPKADDRVPDGTGNFSSGRWECILLAELLSCVARVSGMDGFSETAREHNSGMRDGASKLWVLVREKVGKVETAGEDKGSELFNGADEQDAKMKISSIVEYLILSV